MPRLTALRAPRPPLFKCVPAAQVSYDAIMTRINTWPPQALADKGFAYFGMVPAKHPTHRSGITFHRADWGSVPFSPEICPSSQVAPAQARQCDPPRSVHTQGAPLAQCARSATIGAYSRTGGPYFVILGASLLPLA